MLFLAILLICALASANPNLYQKRYDLGDKPLYNPGLIEGDIAGFSRYGKTPSMRNAIVSEYELWPNSEVPYTLDWSVDTVKNDILVGMEEYHKKTCIRFVPKQDHHKDWIDIAWYSGCWSLVGRNGGEQTVSIGSGCHWKGLVVHELGHAIGFHHEHQRSDRDDYIKIHFENILEGLEHNFEKLKPFENNFLDEKYDLYSVMQYESEAFSNDGKSPTLTPLDTSVTLIPVWHKEGLSEVDVRRVKKLYQCDGFIRPPPPPIPPMTCNFEVDTCGFTSQENMVRYERVYGTLGDRTGWFMGVDATKADSIGARLQSPTMSSYRQKKACVSLKYYIHGEGIYSLNVAIQTDGTQTLLDATESGDKWIDFKKEVDLVEEENHLRFFFTTTMKIGVAGKVAIDDLVLDFNKC